MLPRIQAWVWGLPAALRTAAKEYVYTQLAARGDGPYTDADLDAVTAAFAKPAAGSAR